MQHLGTLEGTGRLSSGGEERGDVRYRIEVSKDGARNIAEARGALEGAPDVLQMATADSEATLTLEDGRTLEVDVQTVAAPSDRVEVIARRGTTIPEP